MVALLGSNELAVSDSSLIGDRSRDVLPASRDRSEIDPYRNRGL
jgi:hypothetical protein